MSYIRFSKTTVVLLLYAHIFHGCQQPSRLNAREEDIAKVDPSAPQTLTPKAKQNTKENNQHAMSGIVLTSSSDSSPNAKHADPAVAGTTVVEASRKVVRKRPATTPSDRTEAQQVAAKQAKKDAAPLAHKEWFSSFVKVVMEIEKDLEDDEAWDTMDQVLNQGAKSDFLEASIMYPNDNNPATTYEYTPLHYAAARGLLALVRELVEQQGISADIQTYNNKSAPLHLASSRGHLDVVQFLVDQGANLELTDSEGGTALHYAAAGRRGEINRDVIEHLVSKGADFLNKMKNNTFPLGLAVTSANLSVIEYWEDSYTKNPDPNVDILTTRALKIAKYRKQNIPQEYGIQTNIVKILTNVLKSRHDKNKEGCVAK